MSQRPESADFAPQRNPVAQLLGDEDSCLDDALRAAGRSEVLQLRTYRFRYYPTRAQCQQLQIEFGHGRYVWNWALNLRSTAYKRWGLSLNCVDLSAQLTMLKHSPEHAWLNDATADCLTQKLRDQDAAFQRFFKGQGRYPRFKRRRGRQSVRYQLDQRHAHRWYVAGEHLQLPKLGPLKIRWSCKPQGIPKMVTISRDAAGRYWVSMTVEESIPALPRAAHDSVGVDLGLKSLAVPSRGIETDNLKPLRKRERQLRRAQRSLSRKQKHSGRWRRQRARVALLHARVADARSNYLHQLSTRLVRENQVIVLEDLNVKGMVRHPRLAKAISDAGFGELRRQLTYKAAWYGRTLVLVDRFYPSSKTCSACGHVLETLGLGTRHWICPECGAAHDRDLNAAKNIEAEGLRQLTIPGGAGESKRVAA